MKACSSGGVGVRRKDTKGNVNKAESEIPDSRPGMWVTRKAALLVNDESLTSSFCIPPSACVKAPQNRKSEGHTDQVNTTRYPFSRTSSNMLSLLPSLLQLTEVQDLGDDKGVEHESHHSW